MLTTPSKTLLKTDAARGKSKLTFEYFFGLARAKIAWARLSHPSFLKVECSANFIVNVPRFTSGHSFWWSFLSSFEIDLTFGIAAVVRQYKNQKSMDWQVFHWAESQTSHYRIVQKVSLSIHLPNLQMEVSTTFVVFYCQEEIEFSKITVVCSAPILFWL